MRKIFVTGIGTEVGKTIVSAILTEALQADYWKPVQTGSIYTTDSDFVKNMISNSKTIIHPEKYCLEQPLSPHAAAELEKINIYLKELELPKTENDLIIEGAGGVMVPLNEHELMLDMIQHFDAQTIVVIKNYLGSINHSLLTIDALFKRNINILGVVFNGISQSSSEDLILKYTGLKCLGRIAIEKEMNKEVILKYANLFKKI
ncbi:MAG: dethiobiotin synthase [Bacteroidetes bacterium]|nr:dethiobiotin synthase [Bacteroidota bacterium]HET6245293.1 dethiobiotin synthase [Bacteroidia bacterium]